MLVFAFGKELASTSAEDFVRELLVGRLGAAGVVTGEDFTFGKGRGGNVALLAEFGATVGLRARAVGPVSETARLFRPAGSAMRCASVIAVKRPTC